VPPAGFELRSRLRRPDDWLAWAIRSPFKPHLE
jgi:hypothetical protein